MYAQIEKPKENKNRVVASSVAQKKSTGQQGFGFEDNRSVLNAHRLLQLKMNQPQSSIKAKSVEVIQLQWDYNDVDKTYVDDKTQSKFSYANDIWEMNPTQDRPLNVLIRELVDHDGITSTEVSELFSGHEYKLTGGLNKWEELQNGKNSEGEEKIDWDDLEEDVSQANFGGSTWDIEKDDQSPAIKGSTGACPCVIFMLRYVESNEREVVNITHVDNYQGIEDEMVKVINHMRGKVKETQSEELDAPRPKYEETNEMWYIAGGELNKTTTYSNYVGIYEAIAKLNLNVAGIDIVRNFDTEKDDGPTQTTSLAYVNSEAGKLSPKIYIETS